MRIYDTSPSKLLFCLMLAVTAPQLAHAAWWNPLSWFEIKHKTDAATGARIDRMIDTAEKMQQTFDNLPEDLRMNLEPLMADAFDRLEKLVGTVESSMLHVAEQVIAEIDQTLHNNINRLDEVLKSNIAELEGMLNRVIENAINGADQAMQKNIKLLIEQLDITSTRKIDLIDLMLARNGEKFMQALAQYTENSAGIFDKILSQRIEQGFVGLDKFRVNVNEDVSGHLNKIDSIINSILRQAGQLEGKWNKDMLVQLAKVDEILDDFTAKLDATSRGLIIGIDSVSAKRMVELGFKLDRLEGIVIKATSNVESVGANLIVGLTKAGIVLVLVILAYNFLLKNATSQLQWSPVSKGLTGAFALTCLTLVVWDKPLQSAFGNPKNYASNEVSPAENEVLAFYNMYQTDPLGQATMAKGVQASLHLKNSLANMNSGVAESDEQVKFMKRHLAIIESVLVANAGS